MSLATSYANYTDAWFTPPEWLMWIARTFGTLNWFDPCPSDYRPSDRSGLDVAWPSPCYVNYPGSRGGHVAWWEKYRAELPASFIWCAFNIEQLRHLRPSPFALDGWLVLPAKRVSFVWGGPTYQPKRGKRRVHGEPVASPGNWAVWWSTVRPAIPPTDCQLVRTLSGNGWSS